MYKVYCDNDLILTHDLPNLNIINAKISQELNKCGIFTFDIYPNNVNYDKLQKLKSIISVYENGASEPIFRGRILDDEQGFYNEKKVTCEGELAFLLDSVQRPYEYTSISVENLLKLYIDNHNAQVDVNHQFTVGNVTVNQNVMINDFNYDNTWDAINKNLINVYGGYLLLRHENHITIIDYVQDLNEVSEQSIKFGKNLVELSKTIKGSDIATTIVPLGAKIKEIDEEGKEVETDQRLDIKSVNGGKDYISDSLAVERYGNIQKVVIFDEIADAHILKTEAQNELAKLVNLSVSIDLTAVDLSAFDINFKGFKIGQVVNIISEPHDLNAYMEISKLEIDLLNPSANKLTLGQTYTTFTEQSNKNENDISKEIQNIVSVSGSKVDIQQVNNAIITTCYTKAETNEKYAKVYSYKADNISQLNGIMDSATSILGTKAVFFSIVDTNNSYYIGSAFFIKNTTSKITKIDGLMNVTLNNNGDFTIVNPVYPISFKFIGG